MTARPGALRPAVSTARRHRPLLAPCLCLCTATLAWQIVAQAWQGPRLAASLRGTPVPSRLPRGAAEGGEAAPSTAAKAPTGAAPEEPGPARELTDAEAAAARGPDRLSSNLRNRLREEAQAWGDESTPVTAGFGNPYLLVIVIVLVLGVASYYQLGLDKIASAPPPSEQEVMKSYMNMQTQMYGGQQ
eukprot:CAMPEP_0179077054 /NCGR_PEP_ID=MMETSP0796-20121207/34418_1 /TAXON_ID=73915 /ORGANISM="Pyrodinium bahamense, Strain pbaha01" /LENGTH=187 /DNA_ID=CAMNT_0020774325 /DNA_START=40 /DNA_END=603 /DNA_ORIENTATION=-